MPQPIEQLVAGTRLPKPGTRNAEYFDRGDDVPLDTWPEKKVRQLLATGSLLVKREGQDPTARKTQDIELKAPKKSSSSSSSSGSSKK